MRAATWALAALAGLSWPTCGKKINEMPMEIRRDNILRVTEKECDECTTMENMYANNEMVFLLFHERALMGSQQYKKAIVSGFHEACRDLRFSHIACGVVDMVEDRAYAVKYIDPKSAPAHIMVRNGEALQLRKDHVEKLIKHAGEKEIILWHLGDLLVGGPWSSLMIAADASNLREFERLARGSQATVVLVPHAKTGRAAKEELQAAAQTVVRSGALGSDLTPPAAVKKSKGDEAKRSVLFVVCSDKKTVEKYGFKRGHAVVFEKDVRLPETEQELPQLGRDLDDAVREQRTVEALAKVAQTALEKRKGGAEVGETQAEEKKKEKKEKKKKDRRKGKQAEEL